MVEKAKALNAESSKVSAEVAEESQCRFPRNDKLDEGKMGVPE